MYKKKLIFIANDDFVVESISHDLYKFFNNNIEIECYNSNKFNKSNFIKGDLLLTLTPINIDEIKQYFNEDIELIQGTRTILKDKYKKLSNIPLDARVAVLNINKRSAFGLTNFLLELGIENLEYHPFYNIDTNINNYDLVIIPNKLNFNLDKINIEILNLEDRRVTVETYKTIISMLDLKLENFIKNIKKYEEKLTKIKYSVAPISTIYKIEKFLKTTIDEIDYGVMVINNNNKIIYVNDSFNNMVKIKDKFKTHNYLSKKIFPDRMFDKITSSKNIDFEILNIVENKKNYILSKKAVKLDKNEIGYIVILRDTQKIESIEMKLRYSLYNKGHTSKYTFDDIIGKSKIIKDSIKKAKKISSADKTVLILGESGTGKEMFAQAIHNFSTRKDKPFVPINCSTLTDNLLESELFGYEGGSFTGAKKDGKKGLFELAHKGTIFLDEIGDISYELQAKLLRVIQEKEIRKIGSDFIIPVDVRIITATNKNLDEELLKGNFRNDLYYRISAFTLIIPPLQDRKDDIPLLVKNITNKMNMDFNRIDKKLMKTIIDMNWRGNIRELKNCIEYIYLMGNEKLNTEDLPEKYRKNLKIYENDSENIFFGFTNKEIKIFKYVLMIIKKRTIGRRKICKICKENNIDLSEYKLRKHLEYLESINFIKCGKGSKGVSITNIGLKYINLWDEIKIRSSHKASKDLI